ncbi:nucleoside triphosphate pyrophosphohydrolase [Kineobactrum sediminis]|uniref:Nucleoside triphosphate pyrophosphohydrolase n=1 Tax=Kineobactrum sediminis TaxID=1905677 RepID=A0A2N5Y437_9GAMM|nr:nucleoside triphosphate pyrophosphohydrolase [Kineobactrum sediminis]PLW83165.1 nucleoside triphosphate pyrophosphohydrolase [Kineobactrum sediminis]
MTTDFYTITDLLRVMERLRDPVSGCPWDIKQDFLSIVPSTLEECYELAEAIEQGDYPHVAEELGDVLFQVIFYSRLGEEQNLFSFESVVHTLVDKLLRRHPHVFAEGSIEGVVGESIDVDEVKRSWESIKQQERAGRAQGGALDDVPVAMPALPRAQKLQKRAALKGFDWDNPQSVLAKLEEECAELRAAMDDDCKAGIADEMGDVLFTCVNLSRHLGLDAETVLRRSSHKFERRFRYMEMGADEAFMGGSGSRDSAVDLARLTALELDQLWNEAKQRS